MGFGFEFAPPICVLADNARMGSLRSITDEDAQHAVGSTHVANPTKMERKTYVYALNDGTAATTTEVSWLKPKYSASGVNWLKCSRTDDTDEDRKYSCVPAAAIPLDYYGWFQVQGEATIATSDTTIVTKETWAAGDELIFSGTHILVVAESVKGVGDYAFAFANAGRATTAVASGDIYLIGREHLVHAA